MTQFEQLEILLNEQGGMIQTSEAIKRGISKPVFYNYVKEKKLEQAAHGIYDDIIASFHIFYCFRNTTLKTHEIFISMVFKKLVKETSSVTLPG